MEFLYRLYSNEYFGVGLFIVIAVLTISFFVILFFGKKDEKARNASIEQDVNEINNDVSNKEDVPLETINISSNVQTEESVQDNSNHEMLMDEEKEEINPFALSNDALNSTLIEPIVEETHEEPVNNDNIFDLNETSNSLNQKVENDTKQPEVSEINPFTDIPPVIEEEKEENIFDFSNPEVPAVDVPKKKPLPTQFSSVYVSKKEEEPVSIEPVKLEEPVIEEEEEDVIAPIPLKPDFDLPKPFDMPKLNQNTTNEETNNIFDK
jgi:hypothetical protein